MLLELILSLASISRPEATCPSRAPGAFAVMTDDISSPPHGVPYQSGDQIRYRLFGDSYTIQSCDTVTADFGDGAPPVTSPATSEIVHSFQTNTWARITTTFTLSNSLGSSQRSWLTYITKSWDICPIWPPEHIVFGGIAEECSHPSYSECYADNLLTFSVNNIGTGG